MSTRRSLSRQANWSSRITEEQINDLVLKLLQAILPEARVGGNDKETCSYIRSLHREMDDLSERLTELLSATDVSSAQATVRHQEFIDVMQFASC